MNKHRITVILGIVACVVVIAILALGLRMNPQSAGSTLIGKKAAPLAVRPLGQEHALPDMQGKPAVINFFASWCESCREEAAELEKVWQSLKAKGGLVIGIAVQDEAEAALGFARRHGKTYALGLDDTGRASVDFGVVGVPETFIVDRQGIVRFKHTGPVTALELEDEVAQLF